MAKVMKIMALCSSALTVFSLILYMKTADDLIFTLLITFGTTAYHFIMRLIVGYVMNYCLKNQVDYRLIWFQVSDFEQNLYKKLKVKKWKDKMPSYDPGFFDSRIHSWDEIAQAMCQAELVHEVIIPLSFVPILAAIPFGALAVFVITSFAAACFDAIFVIMQRYNRPRIIKLLQHHKKDEEYL